MPTGQYGYIIHGHQEANLLLPNGLIDHTRSSIWASKWCWLQTTHFSMDDEGWMALAEVLFDEILQTTVILLSAMWLGLAAQEIPAKSR
jgi:hypothetical protein